MDRRSNDGETAGREAAAGRRRTDVVDRSGEETERGDRTGSARVRSPTFYTGGAFPSVLPFALLCLCLCFAFIPFPRPHLPTNSGACHVALPRPSVGTNETFGDEPAAALHEQPCYLPYPSRHSLHAGGFALACEWSRPVFDSPPAHTSQLTPAVSCQTVGETNTCSRNTQHIELARLSTWTALQPPAHELIKSLD